MQYVLCNILQNLYRTSNCVVCNLLVVIFTYIWMALCNVQLRKIGRKYRMQAEEVQKELEELKTKNAVAEQMSQSDAVALRERLASAEKERDDVTFQLGSVDVEKNEAVRKVNDLEQRNHELHERLVALTEVSNMLMLS